MSAGSSSSLFLFKYIEMSFLLKFSKCLPILDLLHTEWYKGSHHQFLGLPILLIKTHAYTLTGACVNTLISSNHSVLHCSGRLYLCIYFFAQTPFGLKKITSTRFALSELYYVGIVQGIKMPRLPQRDSTTPPNNAFERHFARSFVLELALHYQL